MFLQNVFLLLITTICGVLSGGVAQDLYGGATPWNFVYVGAVFTSAPGFMLESGEPG
jgi:hypothetical protein